MSKTKTKTTEHRFVCACGQVEFARLRFNDEPHLRQAIHRRGGPLENNTFTCFYCLKARQHPKPPSQ